MSCHQGGQIFNNIEYCVGGSPTPDPICLNHGLHPGFGFSIVASTYDRISFNIRDQQGNYLLHFNPRCDQNKVVLNSLLHSKWGNEEIPHSMPIVKGQKFHTVIVYESEGYRIYVNGEEFVFYKHRSHNAATSFNTEGGSYLVYQNIYGAGQPRWAIKNCNQSVHVQDFSSCGSCTPHKMSVQLHKAHHPWIMVTGIVNANAHRIDMNLKDTHGTIQLHFNPRFAENAIVRNTNVVGVGWGQEERTGGLPLVPNQRFTVTFVIENSCFRCFVNGEEFTTFSYRQHFDCISEIEIEQDMKILKIICTK